MFKPHRKCLFRCGFYMTSVKFKLKMTFCPLIVLAYWHGAITNKMFVLSTLLLSLCIEKKISLQNLFHSC